MVSGWPSGPILLRQFTRRILSRVRARGKGEGLSVAGKGEEGGGGGGGLWVG
jgi:hypothetical protein